MKTAKPVMKIPLQESYLACREGKGTRYLTSEVPLLSREYSPRKPTVRSFYPPLFHKCSVLRVFKAT